MNRKSIEFTRAETDAVLRTDLMTFIHRVFCELYPSQVFSDAPHLRIMAAKVADSLLGRGSKRLIICLPPRSLKSVAISVAAPAWVLGLDPTKQIICASYGQELADKHARDTRTVMASSFYKELFPGTRLNPQKLAVNDFYTTKGGFRMATSVGGVLTGRGADILIIDDPLKPDDALSEVARNSANSWIDNTARSRLNSKEDGVIIIVMQRLHQDDLVGHVLEREDWDVVSFPAIAEEYELHQVMTPFGKYPFERKVGDVLDPARESLETLLALKGNMGSYNFSSQYQQNPTPVGGAMIKREWFQRYDPAGPLPNFTTVLQSWDTANKSGELNDYSVCTTWGVYDGRCYLIDVVRLRLNYPELKRQVKAQMHKHTPRTILVEDKASGTQLIQELNAEGNYRVKPYAPPPQTDKIMRVHNATAIFESGKVSLPSSAPWLAEYEREITTFPGAKYDDQVDSTTQALNYLDKINKIREVWAKLGANSFYGCGD